MDILSNGDLLSVGIAVAATLVLGFTVYMSDTESATNRVFCVFSAVTALWGVVNYSSYQFSDPRLTLLLLRGVLLLAVFQAYFLYELFTVYPDRSRAYSKLHNYVLLPAVLLTAVVTLTPAAFVSTEGVVARGQVAAVATGPGMALFGTLAVGLVVVALYRLIRKTYRAQREARRPLVIILIGTAITFAFIITFSFIVATIFADPSYVPFGALFTFPFIAFTSYAILKHHLFNIKVAATAALIFVLSIVTFTEIIFASDLITFTFRVSEFALVLLFGIMLIRTVLKEVEQREEIEKLSEEKSEFMSFASHEIRNPITAMRGYASLVVDGTVGDVGQEAREVAQKILVNGDTVLSLISEFLNKSKVELGQISYMIADIDIGKTVQSISEGFKTHAQEKGLAFDASAGFAGLIARADEAKLREVVGNLIDNSVKYTKTGSITVATEKRNGMARIVVSDTGAGISPETMPHLFQKFSRADAQKMNLLGTGLGLFLAKTFIEGMGGKIWAESDGKGMGSRFIIELHAV